jgi:hypothetical protein
LAIDPLQRRRLACDGVMNGEHIARETRALQSDPTAMIICCDVSTPPHGLGATMR